MKLPIRFFCLLVFMLLVVCGLRAQEEHSLRAIKITEKINIDARLEELAWEEAPRATSFTQREPEEGKPSSEETEIRVLYDKDNLYFGIVAKDSEPGRIIVSELKKDFTIENGDSLQIVLDTFHD